jgi:hypothetical protein
MTTNRDTLEKLGRFLLRERRPGLPATAVAPKEGKIRAVRCRR